MTFAGLPRKLVLSFIRFFSSNLFVFGFQIRKLKFAFFPPNAAYLTGKFDGSGAGIVGTEWEKIYLCNGQNFTPDLRGRFVLGWDDRDPDLVPGSTGGSKDAVVVAHSHTIVDPGHWHVHSATNMPPETSTVTPGAGTFFSPTIVDAFDTSTEITGIVINTEGESPLGANMPPFYILAYIIRIF